MVRCLRRHAPALVYGMLLLLAVAAIGGALWLTHSGPPVAWRVILVAALFLGGIAGLCILFTAIPTLVRQGLLPKD